MDAHLEHPQVEPESPADIPAIRAVVRAAFAHQPPVPDLVDAIRASPQYEPRLSLVARIGGQVAGFVMVSHATLIGDSSPCGPGADGAPRMAGEVGSSGERRHDVLTLSPLAVTPAWQRRGIGSALVRAALAAADESGASVVTLEGSPIYYGRFGFRPAAELGIAIPLPDWAPPEAAQAFPLSGYRPEVRGRLVYPPAFDVLT